MSGEIEILNLSKWYGEVVGINGISALLGSGVTGLLGPNGAGKTTLFRVLTGQAAPSLGEITILGEPVLGNPKIFDRVGFCPEADCFYEDMTGLSFLTTLARIHGYSKGHAKESAEKALARVDLVEMGKKRISAMSKGMRQRVKFAQALLHDPQVILLDEPLNGMDPLLRHKTVMEIRKLGEEGKTVLVSSHILQEVEMMTTRILLMVHGKVLAQGSVGEIRDLLDKHPRKIVVMTPTPRRVASALVETESVVGIHMEGEHRVVLESLRSEPVLRKLTEEASKGSIAVEEVYTADEDLESVFKMLVG